MASFVRLRARGSGGATILSLPTNPAGEKSMLRSKWFGGVLVAVAAAAFTQAASAVPPTSAAPAVSQVTLTVSTAGTGMGWVTSDPAGISCGTICSAQFPVGTSVTLEGHPGAGSTWAWHSAGGPACTAVGPPKSSGLAPLCNVLLSDNASVEWIFNLVPTPCYVPRLKGRTLRGAEQELAQDDCRPGKITLAFSRKVKKGRVISQSPPPHWQRAHGARVNLVLSKGRRQG